MTWTVTKDVHIGVPGNNESPFMVYAAVTYTSDTGEVIFDKTFADTLSEKSLEDQVRRRLAVLDNRDAAFATFTELTGPVEIKAIDPKEQAVIDAQAALFVEQQKAVIIAQAEKNPAVQTAYDTLLAAQAAVATVDPLPEPSPIVPATP